MSCWSLTARICARTRARLHTPSHSTPPLPRHPGKSFRCSRHVRSTPCCVIRRPLSFCRSTAASSPGLSRARSPSVTCARLDRRLHAATSSPLPPLGPPPSLNPIAGALLHPRSYPPDIYGLCRFRPPKHSSSTISSHTPTHPHTFDAFRTNAPHRTFEPAHSRIHTPAHHPAVNSTR